MDYLLKMVDQLRPQLRALRRKHGLTQAQLGAAIGVTQARIVEIEANPGIVNMQQIMQILNAMGAALVIRESDQSDKSASQDASGKSAPGTKEGSW